MNDYIYPLSFDPIFKEKVWGGTGLKQFVNRAIPAGKLIGESWELVDRDNEISVITNGSLKGMTLRDAIEKLQNKLIGTKRRLDHKGRFPLLIKYLDAHQKLSVQVHPDDELACAFGEDDPGKAELWYIIHADPGARIIHGCDASIKNVTSDDSISELLEKSFHCRKISSGDVVFNPAGMVHALLGGTVLLEIQQNSDVTYRLFDWGRAGLNGELRELHLEKGIAAINSAIDESNNYRTSASLIHDVEELIDCSYFKVDLMRLKSPFRNECDGSAFHIVVALEGMGTLQYRNAQIPLYKGDILLLPAALGEYSIIPEDYLETICVS
ncbi:MAG: mannose-6-phosphate isomerase [Candidatus Auribacter fodinae]|jgi:mannose-6-phosphate isomerase|uniref:Phosphohexomutase n=1 Tax=Candidatus Auribacter fodinae TaxID=2093366 RepID=A0A3A4RD65_9BACT|nr:MAG: mannose-6-phosphate isomerase [Candidatus Auribacter fodinae]